ncbi:hypothetical protein C8D87_111106 [Lentzea atacamensis]|uniref:DUF4190 domain-containing protein n=1 Tax=Lentzea atacamensis TaxID=531938 RepID=A0ABX9E0J2_9PSEU|nr:hypothetical protein C8D87_111106 [Lentzea atacamensis]
MDPLKVALVTIAVLFGVVGTLVAVLVKKADHAGRSATWTADAGSFAGVFTIVVMSFNSLGLL